MRKNRCISFIIIAVLLVLSATLGFYTVADNEVPIRLVIQVDSETRLESDGIVNELIFTIINDGDKPYTLHEAHLYGGYDGEDRILNDEISIDAHSSKEFVLRDIQVTADQLDKDIIYTLAWYEFVEVIPETPEPTATPEPTSTPEPTATPEEEAAATIDPSTITGDTDESGNIKPEDNDNSDETPYHTDTVDYEPTIIKTERSVEGIVHIEKFVPPVLSVSASVSADAVQSGDTFIITYLIRNTTKYDMSSLRLTDLGVSSEQIELPDTILTAGETMSVKKECVMGEEDILVHPVITYLAVQRQTETESEETLTVSSVIIGIKLDVQQYPSNEEGTSFAITVTNTGNRSMTNVQLYDEINSKIDTAFDLGPQQQKVITFQVPSAYASGLIRTVQFHLTCRDFFNNTFTFRDTNSYECVPYISSEAVRLTLIPVLTKAFYDEDKKLCGTIQFEIRNYSDVRIVNALLSEQNLFGEIKRFDELQRGETFYTATYQLDNVQELSFLLVAHDTSGKAYETEIVKLDLSQLESLASEKEVKPVIQHSNAFLKSLIDKFTFSFKNAITIALALILAGGLIGLIMWGIEYRIRSKLPRESLMKMSVPESDEKINNTMDQILTGSAAEQLGYRAPAKIRYGDIKTVKTKPETVKKHAPSNTSSQSNLQRKRALSEKKTYPERIESESLQDENDEFISLKVEDINPRIGNSELPEAKTEQQLDPEPTVETVFNEQDQFESYELVSEEDNINPITALFAGIADQEDSGCEHNDDLPALEEDADSETQAQLNTVSDNDIESISDQHHTFGPVIIEFRPRSANKKMVPDSIVYVKHKGN